MANVLIRTGDESITVTAQAARRLLEKGDGDAALLYLYLKSGNDSGNAAGDLHLNEARLGCAEATLRQLGLLADERVKEAYLGKNG